LSEKCSRLSAHERGRPTEGTHPFPSRGVTKTHVRNINGQRRPPSGIVFSGGGGGGKKVEGKEEAGTKLEHCLGRGVGAKGKKGVLFRGERTVRKRGRAKSVAGDGLERRRTKLGKSCETRRKVERKEGRWGSAYHGERKYLGKTPSTTIGGNNLPASEKGVGSVKSACPGRRGEKPRRLPAGELVLS